MARLKKISEEERAAKNELRKMGVSDYELNRLYDANYKARQRVSELTGAELADLGNKGKPLSLSWQQVLRQARQAETQGKTATQYIEMRRANLSNYFRKSTVKAQSIDIIFANKQGVITWAQEALNKFNAAEVNQAQLEAIEMISEDSEDYQSIADAYRNAKKAYERTGATTQAEWDYLLSNELVKNAETNESLRNYTAEILGVDIEALDDAEAATQEYISVNFDLSTTEGAQAAQKYYDNAKREALRKYGGR